MVNLEQRLAKIKKQVDAGEYFSINRARQYGKTTLLNALAEYLKQDYTVIQLDFQLLSHEDFSGEAAFSSAFSREVLTAVQEGEWIPEGVLQPLRAIAGGKEPSVRLAVLFGYLSQWCGQSKKPLVLMIDEADSTADNQVFLDFLAQLRGYFIHRQKRPTFHCVILAGVYDVRNLKQKLRPQADHRRNSPWNIASDFTVDMSFSAEDIGGMLADYEEEHHTGMNIGAMAEELYAYTAGYPFLVSRICQIIDERLMGSRDYPSGSAAWSRSGFLEAVKLLLAEKNTLFDSLISKLDDYPKLRDMLYALLFCGQSITYNLDDAIMDMASMFGFIKVQEGMAVVANRIFETRLYNWFLTESEVQGSDIYRAALQDKNQFVQDGRLNMELVLKKFTAHFHDLYGMKMEVFAEEDGRRYFLLYLRPIINGAGNYYIEARTRSMRRTDVIVDYHGEQFVIEMKVWRGEEYNKRGRQQLADYLEEYHLKKGYMLSFNFNKHKQTGVKKIHFGDKLLVEAVV